MGMLAYWVVPNFIIYIGNLGVDTLIRYKWFFIAVAAISLVLLIWVIYLRYLLARKSIESRADLEKHRLELEFKHGTNTARLEHQQDQSRLVGWHSDGEDPPDGKNSSRLSS